TAPVRLKPFQYKLNSTRGPNADPKPAQALPTRFRIVSFGVHAIIIDAIATTITDRRPTSTNSFSCFLAASSTRNNFSKSSVNELEVTNNCDDIVLIIAAKMAASKNPPTSGWKSI